MRLFGRVIGSLLFVVLVLLAVFGGALGVQWLDGRGIFELALDRRPEQPVTLASLDPYTKQVAGDRWFQGYFTTMVLPRRDDQDGLGSAVVTRWQQDRVAIEPLRGAGAEAERYLGRLVRRLNHMQDEVRFVVRAHDPDITISLLDHATYVHLAGTGSVGSTRTRYFRASPGLIRARIAIDVEVQDTPGEFRSTLIHELTHAIGCSGHFAAPAYSRRSVLYQAGQLTDWSQADAAVIRLLYSPWIEPGMEEEAARQALGRFAAAGS